jgi:hypothetical protein
MDWIKLWNTYKVWLIIAQAMQSITGEETYSTIIDVQQWYAKMIIFNTYSIFFLKKQLFIWKMLNSSRGVNIFIILIRLFSR